MLGWLRRLHILQVLPPEMKVSEPNNIKALENILPVQLSLILTTSIIVYVHAHKLWLMRIGRPPR
jgi:hypothetical protein